MEERLKRDNIEEMVGERARKRGCVNRAGGCCCDQRGRMQHQERIP